MKSMKSVLFQMSLNSCKHINTCSLFFTTRGRSIRRLKTVFKESVKKGLISSGYYGRDGFVQFFYEKTARKKVHQILRHILTDFDLFLPGFILDFLSFWKDLKNDPEIFSLLCLKRPFFTITLNTYSTRFIFSNFVSRFFFFFFFTPTIRPSWWSNADGRAHRKIDFPVSPNIRDFVSRFWYRAWCLCTMPRFLIFKFLRVTFFHQSRSKRFWCNPQFYHTKHSNLSDLCL